MGAFLLLLLQGEELRDELSRNKKRGQGGGEGGGANSQYEAWYAQKEASAAATAYVEATGCVQEVRWKKSAVKVAGRGKPPYVCCKEDRCVLAAIDYTLQNNGHRRRRLCAADG